MLRLVACGDATDGVRWFRQPEAKIRLLERLMWDGTTSPNGGGHSRPGVEARRRSTSYRSRMDEPPRRLRPRTLDALLVVAVASIALVGLTVARSSPQQDLTALPAAAAAVLALVQAGALWWRRSHPLVVVAVTLAALVIAQAAGDINAASFVGPHVAAYSVAVYGHGHVWRPLAMMLVGALADGAVVAWIDDGPAGPVLLGPTGALVLMAWGVGRYVRIRREHLATLQAYARHLEIERDQRAEQAVRDERRRIARELHDQVAHHLGVISLQTSAARRWLERDPVRTADALRAAEDAARQALTTMPAILGALRSEDVPADLEPQPTLADLQRLISRVRDTGLEVQLAVHGTARELHPAVELTAFRLVQEALTNVMKHAGQATVTVELRYGPGELGLEIHDDGYGAAADRPGSGHGLVGMRERVELIGGRLATGPRPGGGFSVTAALPTSAPIGAP